MRGAHQRSDDTRDGQPAAVVWVGSADLPQGLGEHLEERRGPLLLAASEAELPRRVSRNARAVVCFGPGLAPERIATVLEALAAEAPRTACACVVLGPAGELDSLQELIDADRIFFLARAPLPARDLAALIESAAARLEGSGNDAPRAGAPPGRSLDRLLDAGTLRRLALSGSAAELAAELAQAVARAVAASRARVLLFDRELQALWLPDRDPGERHSPAAGLGGFIQRTGVALCLPRVGEDPRFDRSLDDPDGEPSDRFLGVPVRAGGGEVMAVLAALRPVERPPFEPREIAALELLATHVAPYLAPWSGDEPETETGADAPDSGHPPSGLRRLFRRRALRELEQPSEMGTGPLLAGALRPGRFRRIRYVPQVTAADCGVACLVMSLHWHGKVVSLDEVRRITGGGRHGLDANTLIRAGEHFGLRGRGVQLREPEELGLLDPGSILHWGFRHFVVLERSGRRGAWIVDPASGRRFVRREELDRALTGVALTFEPGPEFESGGRKRSLLGRYLRRVLRHNATLGRVLGFSVLIQVCALTLPVLTGLLVDLVIPQEDPSLLWILTGGAAAFAGFALVVNLARARILLALRTRLDAQLSSDFLEHMVRLPFAFFQQRSAGDLLMRLGSNATIREILTSSVLSGALDGLMVASYLVLLLVADLRLGLLVAGLAAVRVAILLSAARRRRRLTAETLEAQAATQSYQVQLVAGIEALKACGAEQRAVHRWSSLFGRELDTALARGRLDALVNSSLSALALASPIAVLLYGAARVMAGDLTLGTMLSLAALAAGFLAPLSTLVGNAAQFQLLGSYLERLEDVLSTPAEPDGLEWPRPGRFSGRIALDGVFFRYGPLVPPALDDVSFEVAPGQLVAVAGPSGSGKSTLAGVVAGLLAPASGRLLYDGRPLAELPREWLRSHLSYVPQQPFLFGTSVRANIALQDPTLPLERVIEAARLARIDDEIQALPMGYETVLADGGTSLSGGQRQRIALARALVGRPRVLILDEATSALDAVTEDEVQRNLRGLGVTLIVAAHRLSTIRDADRILVLERGRVVDSGTHEELIARPGLYRRLAEAQLDGDGDPAARFSGEVAP